MPRPTLLDLLNNNTYKPQAYDRITRRPIHYIDGPIDIGGMIPATGLYTQGPKEIFVSNQSVFGSPRTSADKNQTLKHEVLHSIFGETGRVQPKRMAAKHNMDLSEAEHAIINLLLGSTANQISPEDVFTRLQRTAVPSRDEVQALSMIRRLFNFKGNSNGIREDQQ